MTIEPPEPQAALRDRRLSDLTERLLRGDPQVLAEVLRLLGPRTERIIRGRLGGALADADYDDVLSIALFHLWQRRQRFDPSQARLDTWFYVLARNAALDIVRRRKRLREDALGEDADTMPARENAVTETGASRLQSDLLRALEWVSETDRRILLSGLTENELSEELGLKPGTIRVRRLRTKEKLRVTLRDMGHVFRK
jgi:RNA polymerase sigma-70 factor, ECF subfamily